MLNKLNGLISFFLPKYFIMFNFFLCAFKIIIIKGNCLHTIPKVSEKMSFKRKSFDEFFYVIRQKTVLCKREFFV